jgi:hypothetical protein
MRVDSKVDNRHHLPGKKSPHWGILTLDDLPKANVKYSRLIVQLKARYQAAKDLGDDKSKQKTEDFSS